MMSLEKHMKSFALIILLALALPAFAQPQDDQSKTVAVGTVQGKQEAYPVLVPKAFLATSDAGAIADDLRNVFNSDLTNSDLFDLIDPSPYPAYNGETKLDNYKNSPAVYVALFKIGLAGNELDVEARFYDLKSQQLIVGKVYKWDKKFVRQIAHRFADEIFYRLTGFKGIFTSKVAFTSDRTNNKEVFLMDYDGFNQKQITISTTLNLSPDLSPDGKKLAYTSFRTESGKAGTAIVVFSIYTGEKRFLFSKGTLNSTPRWTPDSTKLAFTSNVSGNAELYVINADGSGLRQLTFNRAIETSPSWNPKSGQIAFTSDRSGSPMIFIMNDDGTNESRLTYVGEYNESAAWSPDGSRLAYVSRSGINFDIYVVDMANNIVTRLTQNEGSNENPCWAPDSRHIAFSSNRTGAFQIWSMLYDGTKPRQLTREGNNTHPSWAAGED